MGFFMRRISFCEALNEAMIQTMELDPDIFVYGIGVPDHKRIFGSTNNILEKFGSKRCFDTPLCEETMVGFALGAAIGGMKPIHINIRVDFLMLAMNQIVNNISTFSYLTNGKIKIPMVIRAIIGRGWGQGSQHSKSLHSLFAHIPGLKVVLPTTPRDAKGLLIASIRDESPVIFIEHRWLYWAVDEVPLEPFEIPLGKGRVVKEGKDITIVAVSWMNVEALKAAEILTKRGISVEIIDPRTIQPLDEDLIFESVRKTGHCLIADNDWLNCGFSSEVSARVSENCFSHLKSPIQRIGFAPAPCPTVRHLENEFYPNAKNIVQAIEAKFGIAPSDLSQEDFYTHESRFKGPF